MDEGKGLCDQSGCKKSKLANKGAIQRGGGIGRGSSKGIAPLTKTRKGRHDFWHLSIMFQMNV